MLSAYPHLEGAYHFGEGVLPGPGEARPVDQPGPGRRQRVGAVRRPAGRLVSARVAVVVGNPKPRSRTYESALVLADRLGGADLVVDLADHASELFDWGRRRVTELVEEVAGSLVVVVASPTYKATYTGLLKAFLDRFPHQGLGGVTAIPLMLGASPVHALAVGARAAPAARRAGRVRAHPRALRPRLRARPARDVRRLVRHRAAAPADPARSHPLPGGVVRMTAHAQSQPRPSRPSTSAPCATRSAPSPPGSSPSRRR